MKYLIEVFILRKYLMFFVAMILLISLISCQQRQKMSVSLSVDPSTLTPDSTATVQLSASFDVGITMAKIIIDGQTVKNGDTLLLEYLWKPTQAKTYILEGYVENIFGQQGYDQRIIKVVDKTAPVIQKVDLVPAFPEARSTAYLSVLAEDFESEVIKVVAKIGSQSVEAQTIDRPIVLQLPELEEGDYPLNVIVSTSDFAKSSTSTVLHVYPVDTNAPTIEMGFEKSFFSPKENVALNIQVEDDTEISSLTIECDGTESYSKTFAKTSSAGLSVNLGTFDYGYHSVTVLAKDLRGKTTVKSDVFAVGMGPADVKLSISNPNPSPADLVELSVQTNETLVKQITFYVDGTVISQGTAFSCCWKAVSGRHVLSVLLETTDDRVGKDCVQIDVQDNKPPKIESFKIGPVELKTDVYESISAGYYGVRLTISDDTAVKQGNTVTVIVSSKEFPQINPVGTIILVQESVSDDLKGASYVGAISLTQGRFYLIPTGVSDIYENLIQNLQFLLEVK